MERHSIGFEGILKIFCDKYKEKNDDSFYRMARDLADKGLTTEAYIIILATWNNSHFRHHVNRFNMPEFENALEYCEPAFESLNGNDFGNARFYGDRGRTIKNIYGTLAHLPDVGNTGASKIMHLRKPWLLVPWDSHIREHYGFTGNARTFLQFQRDMQKLFNHIKPPQDRTLPKAIDEYNYMTITSPQIESARSKK